MSTRVRAGLAADAASLAAIRASVAAGDPEASAGTPQGGSPGPDYFERWLEKERGLIYVAEIGGAAAGYLAMQQAGHPAVAARHPVQLCQLYVIPALHGGGVAALLMSAGARTGAHARE
jgi:GNAT superfamily N-acetyltransferase